MFAPTPCGICGTNPAAFEYELISKGRDVERLEGRSCLICAKRLLRAAEYLQMMEWTEMSS